MDGGAEPGPGGGDGEEQGERGVPGGFAGGCEEPEPEGAEEVVGGPDDEEHAEAKQQREEQAHAPLKPDGKDSVEEVDQERDLEDPNDNDDDQYQSVHLE